MIPNDGIVSAFKYIASSAVLCVLLLGPRLTAQQQNQVDRPAYSTDRQTETKVARGYSQLESHVHSAIPPSGVGAAGFAATGPTGAWPRTTFRFSSHRGARASSAVHPRFAARGMGQSSSGPNVGIAGLVAEQHPNGRVSPSGLNNAFSQHNTKHSLGSPRSPLNPGHENLITARRIGAARVGSDRQISTLPPFRRRSTTQGSR